MTSRRTFLTTAGLAAVAVGAAGCTRSAPTGPAPQASPVVRVPAADVPVGSGLILSAAPYVVTQPTAGEYRAFSKTCTHQGCPVSSVEDDEIECRCHGARYSVVDGAVTNGPATRPLRSATATVEGDEVLVSG